MGKIDNDWDDILQEEFEKDYFKKLKLFLADEYKNQIVYPPAKDVLNALKCSAYKDTKVVIFGQDPYHQPNQAHGLSFSVNKGVTVPPSLVNIYKELEADLGIKLANHGNLEAWAKQGVLLLNTVLTVRQGEPNSHKDKGWEIFTNEIVKQLNMRKEPMVFILWGANGKAKSELITNKEHMVITGAHPSPLSAWRGFFGGGYFSKTNRFLTSIGQQPINWELT